MHTVAFMPCELPVYAMAFGVNFLKSYKYITIVMIEFATSSLACVLVYNIVDSFWSLFVFFLQDGCLL